MLYHPPGLASPTELKRTRNICQNRLPQIDNFRGLFGAWNWSLTYQKMYWKPDHPKWTFVLYFTAINVICYVRQKIGYWGHVVVKFMAKIRRGTNWWLAGKWSHSDISNSFVELSTAFCNLWVPIYSPKRPAGDICCAGCGHPAHQYEKLQDLWRKLRYRARIFWFPLGGKPHFSAICT